jgi:8-oxo-dGTP pyrophosphatase MutT (NUDIX family)
VQDWIQVGGHGEQGENEPFNIALREATEETSLIDLRPIPSGPPFTPIQAIVLPVPAKQAEPAHEHGDLRYVLETAAPELARPETRKAQLKWIPIESAAQDAREQSLRIALDRVAVLLD